MPDEQRLEMCRTVLEIAQRDEEKELLLEVLRRYPSADTLRMAAQLAQVPALKNDATEAVLVIADAIQDKPADLQQILAQLGQQPVKLEIVKAEYGGGANYKNVTRMLRKYARDLPLIVLPSSSYNSSFGGDPAPGVRKELKVQYRMNGKVGQATFAENAAILLPAP